MTESTIAFAGMLQASELVRQVATSGNCSQQGARASLSSVFDFEPESTVDVYGGIEGVRLGLRVLIELFSARQRQESLQSLNYALGLAKLGAQVERDRARQQALGQDIELVAPAWRNSDDALDETISSQLADVYQRHVSTLPFRLSISGQPEYLKQSEKVAFIRALLLAGIRSAFLWRQLGGRQWRLVFQRRRMLREAQSLLDA